MLLEKQSDHLHQHHLHLDSNEEFVCTDGVLFDRGLHQINSWLVDIVESRADLSVLIELARGSGDPRVDVTYTRALEIFDSDLWQYSTVIYLEAGLETQIARNRDRREGGGPPESVLLTVYACDDIDALTAAGIEWVCVDARGGREEVLERVVRLVGLR